jgi:hypothetical protein
VSRSSDVVFAIDNAKAYLELVAQVLPFLLLAAVVEVREAPRRLLTKDGEPIKGEPKRAQEGAREATFVFGTILAGVGEGAALSGVLGKPSPLELGLATAGVTVGGGLLVAAIVQRAAGTLRERWGRLSCRYRRRLMIDVGLILLATLTMVAAFTVRVHVA